MQMRGLSDTWHGSYSYPPHPAFAGNTETAFVATLLDDNGVLSGATHERRTAGHFAGLLLNAVIDGQRDGAAVTFTKTYEAGAFAVAPHPIVYTGGLNADASEIAGTWQIPLLPPGRFVMIRANRPAFAAERDVAAPIERRSLVLIK
jgi:hypothetical protein